ncbi:MBOAT family O-acyltransferase [Schaedlerella arabinosiphila]|uniref:MBOAT family O-acyltransferase n=1 Tax=Schaedlerella arabinosiphila TaxID=2044587 RepID=UPI001FAA4CE7|nr:MBOAT family O-acyltransferase [Schaedlerella arabinosiphila]
MTAVAIDLGFLFVVKYLSFFLRIVKGITGRNITIIGITLPIGISFFTFQMISYVIDVYKERVEQEKSILNVSLYISFFPQLIAGPIVRYNTISEQIRDRKESFEKFGAGTERFMCGFAKKVIIANNLALITESIFGASSLFETSIIVVWLAIIGYALQIYYDFSGYSDMAIGLGKMFGFDFDENFNYPYMAKSITDFWRRWHISLSAWFKDYVYIPLGGNRGGKSMLEIYLLFGSLLVYGTVQITLFLYGE